MTKKKLKDFSYYVIISFIFFLLFTFFIIIGFIDEKWTVVLFERRLSYLPLFIYIFLFALIPSFLFFSYFNLTKRRKEKKVENALKMLNKGQYSAPIFLNMFSDETPIQINSVIDNEFIALHKKFMLISEEAISSAQQSAKISEETKEEILEGERHRIARELHDSVSQQLFAAAMLLSTIQAEENEFSPEIQSQISLINDIIDEAQTEMRALLLHLRPVKLSGKSLKIGIEQLLDELKSKVPINIIHEIEDIQLTEVVEDHLFRIIQELLSNVLRHSKAKELEVYLKETNDFYQLNVIDDGDGFDMEENENKGFGLSNIKERIAGLGGTVRIISFPNQGTSIKIRIPLITKG